ncbi:hypothetical protein T11_11422 [Trichinella zimbabwensis]|uniref:Uncharacterized protein n=1 Tax=Trichinella zimbabwensis TaxID=268475 RepID=A0A0V1GGA8_9BILA|nr:hypothetical protein T11_11422 [Trichinella zimbabwensis]
METLTCWFITANFKHIQKRSRLHSSNIANTLNAEQQNP